MIKHTDDPIDLPQRFLELTDNRERQGLALRPPKRLLRLLHLVKEHAAAIAFRPISFGNKDYLVERVKELHRLCRDMKSIIPELKLEWQVVSSHICRLLEDISVEHKKRAFSRIVWLCDQTRYRKFWKQSVTYVPDQNGPLIKKEYKRVVIVTGPGIGLGDEISGIEFVRSLKAVLSLARFDLYSFYPGFWEIVEHGFRVHSLVGSPMQAFDCVDNVIKEGETEKALLLFINFSGLFFHLAFCLEKVKPDMVEIAVGNGVMWFAPGDGSPVQVARAMDHLYPNNYTALRKLSIQLLGPVNLQELDHKELAPGLCKEVFQVTISPFTSKPIFLSPQDWALILLKTLKQVPDRKPVFCFVLPGMSEHSEEYARLIVNEAKKKAVEDFDIQVLGNKRSSHPDSAFQKVYNCMCGSDLLIGIDTYTAHLAAMLSIPSVTLCYERNVAFWPDKPNSNWIELCHNLNTTTELTSLIFSLSGGLKSRGASIVKERLRVEDFLRLEADLDSKKNDKPFKKNQKIVNHYNAAWNCLPANYQTLIYKLDYNYAWPRINTWISSDSLSEKSFLWILDIMRKSHFRKIVQMIINFGQQYQKRPWNEH